VTAGATPGKGTVVTWPRIRARNCSHAIALGPGGAAQFSPWGRLAATEARSGADAMPEAVETTTRYCEAVVWTTGRKSSIGENGSFCNQGLSTTTAPV
jgi:hypothetical protein